MSDGQAATFVQSYMTAWFALKVRARAEAEALAVHGSDVEADLARRHHRNVDDSFDLAVERAAAADDGGAFDDRGAGDLLG